MSSGRNLRRIGRAEDLFCRERWHYSSTERCLVCTYLSTSLLSVPVIMSEPATRPRAILTQDFESSVLMWVLEHWVRIGDPTVNTDLWCVLWVVWLFSHATQHANGDFFFPESRVVVWKLNVTNNQKGSVKHLETGGGVFPARRYPEWISCDRPLFFLPILSPYHDAF